MCKDEAWSCTKPAISTEGCRELFTETFRSHTVQLAIHLFLRRASDTGMLRSDNHKKKIKIQHQRGGGEGGGILQNMRFSMAINLCHKNVTSPLVLLIFSSICY